MRNQIIQGLAVLLLVLAIVWFVTEPGYQPVITAIVALVGLFSVEFLKGDPSAEEDEEGGERKPASDPSRGARR